MKTQISVDSREFTRNLNRFAAQAKIDLDKYTRDQAGMFVKEVVKHTYPKKKQVGTDAVKRDLSRSVKAIRPKAGTYGRDFSGITNESLRKRLEMLVRSKNHAELEKIMQTWKGKAGVKVRPFTPALHKSQRDGRGRVTSEHEVYTLEDRKWNKYRSKKMSRVGLVKYGWVGAAAMLRREGAVIKLAAWIEKKRDLPTGTATKITSGGRKVYIMRNPYGYMPGYTNTVKFVLDLRARKMKSDINRILRGGAHKYGLKTR